MPASLAALLPALACGSGGLGLDGLTLLLGIGLLVLAVLVSPFLFCALMAIRRHRRFAWLSSYRRPACGPLSGRQGELLELRGTVREWKLNGDCWELQVGTDAGEQVLVRESLDGSDLPGPATLYQWECPPGMKVSVLGRVGTDLLPQGYREVSQRTFVDAIQVQPVSLVRRWRTSSLRWLLAGFAWFPLLLGMILRG
jgi:hypothetical protein